MQPTRRQLGSGRRARAQQSALGGKKGNRTIAQQRRGHGQRGARHDERIRHDHHVKRQGQRRLVAIVDDDARAAAG